MVILAASATLALLAFVGLLLHPARPWDLRPLAEDEPAPPLSGAPPSVTIIVPARNEAASLPATLPSLLTQDHPGVVRVIVVDDRSDDATADVARRIAREHDASDRVRVVRGAPLPPGWVGKVWAMQQGLIAAGVTPSAGDTAPCAAPDFVLFTDADIRHAPGSLRRLVAESERDGLALDSRMARLSCATPAERLLIPAFAFFFAVLYPMRLVNDPRSRVAAAAGGCMLLRASVLAEMGGVEPIRDRIIDDVSLARAVKARGKAIRLACSRDEVVSLREYATVADVWRMVRRSAFTELKHSWLRLVACLAALGLVFVAPIAAIVTGAAGLPAGEPRFLTAALGLSAVLAAAACHLPAIRRFDLPAWRALLLPIAGVLYGLMTLDSALRHARRQPESWRATRQTESPATVRNRSLRSRFLSWPWGAPAGAPGCGRQSRALPPPPATRPCRVHEDRHDDGASSTLSP